MRRNQIMRLAAVEIYNEITGYWLWPFGTPDIEHVIDRSMRRVARLISKDYRAPIKVQCCGFTIFRCCCRKRNPKSNLLHNIVDGLEEREGDMMYDRGVTDFVDRGDMRQDARGNGKYLLENDAYEAEQRLRRMEEGTYGGDRSYYSEDGYSRGQSYDSRGYPIDQYTEEGDTYARDIAAGDGYSRGGYSRSGYSMDETLTRSEQGWDEASESQYGY